MNSIKNTSSKIALGSLISALSVVLLFMTGIVPYASYALPALAGMLVVVLVIDVSKQFALTVYVVVAILAIFFCPDVEAKVLYVSFFGFYPILKGIVEKNITKKATQWIVKFIIFNAGVLIGYFVILKLFGLPQDDFMIYGVNMWWLMLIAGNFVFLLYDFVLTRVITLYVVRFRDKLLKLFKM